jgi:hypothetical protein
MASADIRISISGGDVISGNLMRFEPGNTIQCSVNLTPQENIKCNKVVARVMWHTEGRGDRDEGVAVEIPIAPQGTLEANRLIQQQFNVVLPKQPWSYAGYYVNIVWELKVSIDIPFASDINASQPFVLAPRL